VLLYSEFLGGIGEGGRFCVQGSGAGGVSWG